MEISDTLLCLFSAQIEERNGSYLIEVPEQEVTQGAVHPGEPYRVAVLGPALNEDRERDTPADTAEEQGVPEPPVQEGEYRTVTIADRGEQGDGIARVERGYVVIVPNTDVGDEVTVEITDVRQNFAFGEIVQGRG